MTTLVEFLRARLDEDGQVARAASGRSPWTLRDHEADYWKITGSDGSPVVYDEGDPTEAEATHIARHDPTRVMAEVAAKRAIIDRTLAYEAKIDGEWACCHEPDEIAAGLCPETPPGEIRLLRLLAAPYADHPDFDRSWTETS